jgi:hypothetical protein
VNPGNAWATKDKGLPTYSNPKSLEEAQDTEQRVGIPVPECKTGTFEGSIAWCTSSVLVNYLPVQQYPHFTCVLIANPDIAIARCSAAQCFCFLQAARSAQPTRRPPQPSSTKDAAQRPAQKRTARRKAGPCPGWPMMPLTQAGKASSSAQGGPSKDLLGGSE